MRFRSTLLYLGAALLIGGYIWFFERGPKKDPDDKGKVLPEYTAADITAVRVEGSTNTAAPSQDPIEMKKDESGTWRIHSPKAYTADETTLRTLLNAAGEMSPEVVIAEPSALSDYGLEPPLAKCRFTGKEGAVHELLVGSKDMAGHARYVRNASDPAVYLVPDYQVDNIVKDLDGYRDKTFFKADTVSVRKLQLTESGRTMTLVQDEDGTWSLTSPLKARALGPKVRDFLTMLGNLKAQSFEEDHPKSLGRYGLSSPEAMVEVWYRDDTRKSLLVGSKKKDSPYVYAKQGEEPAVVTIGEQFKVSLKFKVEDFRDRTTMQFEADSAKTLKVSHNGKTVTYTKGEDAQWTAPGRSNAQEEAANLVSQLSQTQIDGFADPAGPTGLKNSPFTVEVVLQDGKTRIYRYGRQEGEKVHLASDRSREAFLVAGSVLSLMETCFSPSSTAIPLPEGSPTP